MMRFFSLLFVVALNLSSSTAFSVPSIKSRVLPTTTTTIISAAAAAAAQTHSQHDEHHHHALSPIDLMAIENVAELCLTVEDLVSAGCDLDQHEALVNRLMEQRDLLQEQAHAVQSHLQYLDSVLERLKGHEGAQRK